MAAGRFPIPIPLLLIDLFGIVLIVLGALGLNGSLAGSPVLSLPAVAWTLLLVGVATVLAAVVLMALQLSRRAARGPPRS